MKIGSKAKKIIYIVLGCIGVGLGAVGAVLPLLPAFPFLMLAAFSFARSSEKLDTWFKGTKLYKRNLETFVKGQGMTWATKIRVMVMITGLMAIGFVTMGPRPVGRIILGVVWVFHIVLFSFIIKTLKVENIEEVSNKQTTNIIDIEKDEIVNIDNSAVATNIEK